MAHYEYDRDITFSAALHIAATVSTKHKIASWYFYNLITCSFMNLKPSKIDIFIQEAINNTNASEIGDYKSTNKSYHKIVKIAKYLKENNKTLLLLELLHHENVGVRLFAATYLLEESEEIAIRTLKAIEQESNSITSFCAKMTIEEWTNGNMKLQY